MFLQKYIGALEDKNFVKLWISQLLSEPAGHMLNFLLAIRIYQLTGNNFVVSIFIVLVSIPPVLFSSFAGVIADHVDRKLVMVFSNLIRAIVVLGFFLFHTVPAVLLGLAFIISIVSQFFGPTQSATIPTFAKREHLFQANSIFLSTTYASFLIGYSLAGPLLYHLGDKINFIILFTMYSLAMIANLSLPSLRFVLTQEEKVVIIKSFKYVFRKIIEGLKIIKDTRAILYSILQMTFIFVAERAIIGLAPDIAQKYLHFKIDEISYYLIIPIGLGALVGALFVNRIKKYFPRRKIINWGLTFAGVSLVLLPFYYLAYDLFGRLGMLSYIILLCILTGFTDVCVIVTAQTLIHETSYDGSRGRIFGNLIAFMNVISIPVILLVGLAANYYAATYVIGTVGVLLTLAGLTSRFFYKRSLRLLARNIKT
jgi:MFS family permease